MYKTKKKISLKKKEKKKSRKTINKKKKIHKFRLYKNKFIKFI